MDPAKGDRLYRTIIEGLESFYSDPENMKAFEEWKRKREEKRKNELKMV